LEPTPAELASTIELAPDDRKFGNNLEFKKRKGHSRIFLFLRIQPNIITIVFVSNNENIKRSPKNKTLKQTMRHVSLTFLEESYTWSIMS